MRKMTKESKISPRTMRRICHNDLKISPYKLQKRQLILGATIEETGQKQTIAEMTQKWHTAKILSLLMKSYLLCNKHTITKMIKFWQKP